MYNYEEIRPQLFTDEGQRKLLKVRDNVANLLKQAGAVRMQEALAGVGGDSWEQLACVDRLVELGEIREVTTDNPPGQYRVFVQAAQPATAEGGATAEG